MLKKSQDKPFWKKKSGSEDMPKKKRAKLDVTLDSDVEIVKACYLFVTSDVNLYKYMWNWGEFFGIYWDRGCERQKLYTCRIFNILTGASQSQLSTLLSTCRVTLEAQVCEEESHEECPIITDCIETDLQFDVKNYVNIEGVLLPVFTKDVEYVADDPHLVNSTRTNLRSTALGISSNKPVCLCGPVGSGKTMLVEYLARITCRTDNFINENNGKATEKIHGKSIKRPIEEIDGSVSFEYDNAFSRVQLGDQTDSKTLLGQYR